MKRGETAFWGAKRTSKKEKRFFEGPVFYWLFIWFIIGFLMVCLIGSLVSSGFLREKSIFKKTPTQCFFKGLGGLAIPRSGLLWRILWISY